MANLVIIIGAGIVGLSTAYQLQLRFPKIKIVILEKENEVAKHQTGNNSGVIHSGIYYKPGSQKAINCKSGYEKLIEFSQKNNIKYDICGKLIAAINKEEKVLLDNIFKRGIENGLTGIKKISSQEAKEIEPHLECIEAVYVPQSGIINYKKVSEKYKELFEKAGGKVVFNSKVLSISEKNNEFFVSTNSETYQANLVITCSGLWSDVITKMTVPDFKDKVLPFRGEYYEIKPEKQYLVNNLIYPVPNPNFPFLGVHFTRMIDGGIEAGPNAVLAFRREGYKKTQIHLGELFETLAFSGFRKVAGKYWRDGLDEMKRSYFKSAFTKSLQKLIPEITENDLIPGGAGVRAQVCDPAGNLIDDFLILENKGVINVVNAPSPAATASLAIGKTIVELAKKQLN